MNNVFNCPICWMKYSKSIRLPISLNCGHVICKICVKNMTNNNILTCTIDKTLLKLDLDNLQICYTILDNLNENQNSDYSCKTHPTKRLKYYCNYDNEYICSNCLGEHSKLPHKVSQYLPRKKSCEEEIGLIKKHIEEKQIVLNNQNKKLSDIKHKLHESTKKQLEVLDSEINNLIAIIKKQRDVIEDKIKVTYKNQVENIDSSRKTINQNLSNLSQLMGNTLRMIQKLESNKCFNFRSE